MNRRSIPMRLEMRPVLRKRRLEARRMTRTEVPSKSKSRSHTTRQMAGVT